MNSVVTKTKIKTILNQILVIDYAFFLAFGIYHKNITKICFVIGFILYLFIRIIEHGKVVYKNFFVKTALNKAVYLFLGISFLSVIFSRDFYHSQEIFFQRYLPYFLSFFIGVYLARDKKYFKILIFSLLAGAFIFSIGGVISIVKAEKIQRLFTIYGFDVMISSYYLYVLPFFVSAVIFHNKLKIKLVSFLMGAPLFICFLFNFSRSAWLSLLLSFLVALSFIKKRKALLFFIVIAAFIAIFVTSSDFALNRIKHQSLIGARKPLAVVALKIFQENPVLGAGIGVYENILYNYGFDPGKRIFNHTENTYLELLAEAGILGLLSFVWIFILLFKNYFKEFFNKYNVYDVSFLALIISMLIFDLGSSTFLVGVSTAMYFWILLGIYVGYSETRLKTIL